MLDRFLIASNAFLLGMLLFGTPPPNSVAATWSVWWLATPVIIWLVLFICAPRPNQL